MTTISDRTIAYLDAWYSQNPTFALMGEFSAGKSTLLNLIIGEVVLPTQVTATNLPVIWMTYADTPEAFGLSRDGTLEGFEVADLGTQGKKDYLMIRLGLPVETLRQTDIIDTPGISDRRLAADALDFIKPYLDFVVWCSAANQAWRQTEKVVWQSIPQSTQDQSILALTRADLMSEKDLGKVIKRCQTDTAGMFRLVQPIATVAALAARNDDGDVMDQSAWANSHAETLFDEIKASLKIAQAACAARPSLDVPMAETSEPVPAPEPEAVEEQIENESTHPEIVAESTSSKVAESSGNQGEEKAASASNQVVQDLLSELRQLNGKQSSKDQIIRIIDHNLTRIESEKALSEAHQTVLIRAMSLDGSGDVPIQRVKAQLEREIEDFADTDWCRLDQVH